MSQYRVRAASPIAAACLLTMLPAAALASGAIFKDALFSDRTGFLLQIPAGGLSVPPPGRAADGLRDEYGGKVQDAETFDIPHEAASQIQAMRLAESGDLAWTAGQDVPQAARLYTAGAVDFLHQRWAEASARFQAILTLPWPVARPRAAWAAYMLGRIALAQGDVAGTQTYFPKARALVLEGARDELGLGVASYGEQARLLLRHGNIVPAVHLYMSLAAALASASIVAATWRLRRGRSSQ